MISVERHHIPRHHPVFAEIDRACFASKNLYNKGLYEARQNFFTTGKPLSQAKLAKRLKESVDYRALPAKVAQLVLMQVDKSWQSYFAAKKAYKQDPSQFTGEPRIPKYLDKGGRNLVSYNRQAINAKTSLAKRILQPSGLPGVGQTQQDPQAIREIRIVPQFSGYVVEVV